MLIEVTSQTYRSLIPIVPWLQFLVDTEHGGGTLFAYILCGTYIIFKATQLYGKTQELRNAVSSFRLDVVSLRRKGLSGLNRVFWAIDISLQMASREHGHCVLNFLLAILVQL